MRRHWQEDDHGERRGGVGVGGVSYRGAGKYLEDPKIRFFNYANMPDGFDETQSSERTPNQDLQRLQSLQQDSQLQDAGVDDEEGMVMWWPVIHVVVHGMPVLTVWGPVKWVACADQLGRRPIAAWAVPESSWAEWGVV